VDEATIEENKAPLLLYREAVKTAWGSPVCPAAATTGAMRAWQWCRRV